MMFGEPGNNLALAVFHVRRLLQLRVSAAGDEIDAVMRPLFSTFFQSRFFPVTAFFPKAYYAGDQTRKILYIDGVNGAGQASQLWNGYDNGSGPLQTIAFNPYFTAGANHYDALINAHGLTMPEYLDVVGYSGGGAIGVALKDKWIRAQSLVKSRVVTFGSPRTGNRDMQARLSRSHIVRWMTDADPVPLVPPSGADVPAMLFTQPWRALVRYGNFRHTQGGVVVFSAGNTLPAIIPPTAAVSATGSMISWLTAQENAAGTAHNLNTYHTFLTRALEFNTRPADQVVEDGPREPEEAQGHREINQQRERVRAEIANAAREQNGAPIVVPKANLMRAAKVGGAWVVLFGDELILVAGREDRARSIARSGNDFLRKLPRQALVDPFALTAQFQGFLELAADPTSGFVPPIRIGL